MGRKKSDIRSVRIILGDKIIEGQCDWARITGSTMSGRRGLFIHNLSTDEGRALRSALEVLPGVSHDNLDGGTGAGLLFNADAYIISKRRDSESPYVAEFQSTSSTEWKKIPFAFDYEAHPSRRVRRVATGNEILEHTEKNGKGVFFLTTNNGRRHVDWPLIEGVTWL